MRGQSNQHSRLKAVICNILVDHSNVNLGIDNALKLEDMCFHQVAVYQALQTRVTKTVLFFEKDM